MDARLCQLASAEHFVRQPRACLSDHLINLLDEAHPVIGNLFTYPCQQGMALHIISRQCHAFMLRSEKVDNVSILISRCVRSAFCLTHTGGKQLFYFFAPPLKLPFVFIVEMRANFHHHGRSTTSTEERGRAWSLAYGVSRWREGGKEAGSWVVADWRRS